ncbi:hypothetical protein [Streptomyces sp. NBC_01190]|uniref:hypothetical protein n=1 Tax=Streptomyces sp. NBC_01190 TaxID=2903767 RepID=UPI003868329C|nr:hypothetical protein OG519_30615 [Streptomyces sp. NBC_01190]
MTFPAQERRALLIGVSGFHGPAQDPLGDLDFARDAVQDLAAVLTDGFGFSVTAVTAATEATEAGLTTARLGELVRETVEAAGSDSVLLVHLLTHGEARNGTLYALGTDGTPHESTDIGGWLAGLQSVPGRPRVLFTLDLCNSGTVTELPWQPRYDRSGRRGWVVAACQPDRDAFNGHFTKALTTVLGDMAASRTDLTPSAPYIPLGTVVDAVRRTTLELADAHRIYRQYVTTSRVEVSDEAVVLPLFPNPAHKPAHRTGQQPAAGAASSRRLDANRKLGAFLDAAEHGTDLRHFVDSAAGLDGFREVPEGFGAAFTGRAHELRRLSRWLGGDEASPVAVVTGSPGAGKSALVGVLVCAAHPELRTPTRALWENLATAPPPVGGLVAAHARARGLEALTGSLARRLGLGALGPEQLLTALGTRRLAGPPTLVIDAVDEADDPAAVCAWLARVAALTHADGSAAARILLATRPSAESAELRGLAADGHYLDLDQVSPTALLADLHTYVTALLRSAPDYRNRHQINGAFAGALAETLVANRGGGWGEFLVAGLYTRHFLASFDPRSGSDEAEQRGAAAPRGLPEVLDLDLAGPATDRWLRPVLTVVAHARGEGMPGSVIQRAAAALHPESPPSLTDVQRALTAGHTYLRRSVDDDAVTVHRLFHGELAEHLHRDEDADPILRSLLGGLGPAGRRQWPAAEPYVLRHALGHAADRGPDGVREVLADPGYLLRADPAVYLPYLTGSARRTVTRWCAADPAADRRTALALAAVEEDRPDLARGIADLPGEQPLPWNPLWAAGRDPADAGSAGPAVAVITGRGELCSWNWRQPGSPTQDPPAPRALAFGHADGREVLVVGTSAGGLAITDRTGRLATWPWQGGAVTALAIADRDGGSVVVSGTSDGEVTAHELATGEPVGPVVTVPGAAPAAIAAAAHGGVVAVARVSRSGELHSWYCGEAETPLPFRWKTPAAVRAAAVGCCERRLVLAAGCADGAVAVWDMRTHSLKRLLEGSHGPVNAVAIGRSGDRHVVVAGSHGGFLSGWDLVTLEPLDEPIQVDREPIRAIALSPGPDGELHCLVGGDGPTALWSLDRRARLRDFGQDGAVHVGLADPGPGPDADPDPDPAQAPPVRPATPLVTAVGAVGARVGAMPAAAPLAVYGGDDGSCHLVDAETGRSEREPLAGDGHPVTEVEEVVLGGAAAVLVRSARGRRVWDVGSGAHGAAPLWPEAVRSPTDPRTTTSFVAGGLVTVSADADGHVRIGGRVAGRHQGQVTSLLTARLDGRPVAVSGGADGTVRCWDLEEVRPLDRIEFGRPVRSLAAAGDGLLLVGAAGRVYALEHVSRRLTR